MGTVARNNAIVFVQHTRKNLEYIQAAYQRHEPVHPVTQLVNSLLGLIVFPWEKSVLKAAKTMRLEELAKQGWPTFTITLGRQQCKTLYQLWRRLRNGVAHGNITFSSDSLDLSGVTIFVEDYATPTDSTPHWRAEFKAEELRVLCLKLIAHVDGILG